MSATNSGRNASLLLTALIGLLVWSPPAARAAELATPGVIEQWGIFEAALNGPADGNPFTDVEWSATFTNTTTSRTLTADGFYDGDGVYRVRCMPDAPGDWRYVTRSKVPELNGKTGAFACVPAGPGNHGPVVVRNQHHFGYADGKPYVPVGTTCYAWIHQTGALQEQTLKTLAASPFNKLRMLVFPKHMVFNENEPELYPFEGTPLNRWDFTRYNPVFFRHLERRVGDLRALGIEADVILFHPYDKGHWGFDGMGAANDDSYVRYVVARLAAYRNVWWSLANEYDLMLDSKPMADWDRFFSIIQVRDPYRHLASVHFHHQAYDYTRAWASHCSVQTPVTSRGLEEVAGWRSQFDKPVVVDECCYEGNIDTRWGSLSARELVNRFWYGAVGGYYVGHGETYVDPNDVLWWSKGGVLHGQSPPRIAFLRKILEEGPPEGLEPIRPWNTWRGLTAGRSGEYILLYFSFHQPASITLALPPGVGFHVDLIDTWEMTIKSEDRVWHDGDVFPLPRKPGMALRLRKVE